MGGRKDVCSTSKFFKMVYTLLVDSGEKYYLSKAFLSENVNNLKIKYSVFKHTPVTVIPILENVWSMKMRTVS